MSWNALAGDVDALIDYMDHQISQLEYVSASREIPSQDGYGGLIRICDDHMFREQGLISVYVPPPVSSPVSSPATTSSAANTGTSSGESEFTVETYPVSHSFGKRSVPSAPTTSDSRSSKQGEVSGRKSSDVLSVGRSARSLSGLPTLSKPSSRQEVPVSLKVTRQSDAGVGNNSASHANGNPPGGMRNSERASHKNLDNPLKRNEQDTSLKRQNNHQSKAKGGRQGEPKDQLEKLQAQLQVLRLGKVPSGQKRIREALIADEAFRAAAAKLREGGDYSEAVQLAEIAAGACPPDKLAARAKINRLKQVAINRLQAS